MSSFSFKCFIRPLKGILLLLAIPILLIEAGAGCAEINPHESRAATPSSFSVYALSRGKGVPDEARQVLDHSRRLLKRAQERGEVKQIVDRRIGLEGKRGFVLSSPTNKRPTSYLVRFNISVTVWTW